jgi:uncharacterized RDD family membrane protein YckC
VNEGGKLSIEKIVYASLWRRLAAQAIDWTLFCAVFFPVTRLVKGVWLMGVSDHDWVSGAFVFDPLCLVFLVVIIGYFISLEALFGATVGKWLAGVRVVALDGTRPGWRRSLLRNALRAIDGLPAFSLLGIVLILRTPEHARFGDRVAGTRVVLS